MKKILLLAGIIISVCMAIYWQPPVYTATPLETKQVKGASLSIPDSMFVKFNKHALSEKVKVVQTGTVSIFGYPTHNREILEQIILPYVKQNSDRLKSMPVRNIINECILLSFTVYTRLIGNSFYRWGGDIADLDNPQYEGVRYNKKYGLDCSGFAASGYEIAVRAGLVADTAAEALFCSAGLKHYTKTHAFNLRGALIGGNNNYRLDTSELSELGTVVFSLKKGEKPSALQVNQLLPGDIVGLDGHVGIIAFIGNKPYYLESGGYVLPEHEYKAVPAVVALAEFAKHCEISVRRAQ